MSQSEKEVTPLLPYSHIEIDTLMTKNPQSKFRTISIYFLTSIALVYYYLTSATSWSRGSSGIVFTSGSIQWSPCPDVTETFCSYHSVPMDWSSPQVNETVSLALRMLPAIVPIEEQLGFLCQYRLLLFMSSS